MNARSNLLERVEAHIPEVVHNVDLFLLLLGYGGVWVLREGVKVAVRAHLSPDVPQDDVFFVVQLG